MIENNPRPGQWYRTEKVRPPGGISVLLYVMLTPDSHPSTIEAAIHFPEEKIFQSRSWKIRYHQATHWMGMPRCPQDSLEYYNGVSDRIKAATGDVG